KYHDANYAMEALSDLFLSTSISYEDPKRPIAATRIQPVIEKLVDSLHLHTVNMGREVEKLPDELEKLPKHYLAPFTFADAIHAIQKIHTTDILMRLEYSVTDLLSWIYH